jgi:hypothetical protein
MMHRIRAAKRSCCDASKIDKKNHLFCCDRKKMNRTKFLISNQVNTISDLIHTGHFDAQYCDKIIIFEPWKSKGQGKLLTTNKSRLLNKQNNTRYVFKAYLGWSLEHMAQNYLFIAILCAKMSRVKKVLMSFKSSGNPKK